MIWRIIRYLLLLPLLGIVGVTTTMCTQLGLNYASLEVDNKPVATPAIGLDSVADWEAITRPELLAQLEANVFGPVPVNLRSRIVNQRLVDEEYYNGRAVLEEWTLEIYDEQARRVQFNLAIAFPKLTNGPSPLVIGQSFCDNRATFESWDLSPPLHGISSPCGGEEGFMDSGIGNVFTFIFGDYIAKAPMDEYLNRGIAYASFFASEVVIDSAEQGATALEQFPRPLDGASPSGAIAAWAGSYMVALDHLDLDARIDGSRVAVVGHSRHGKAALVAGAWDERIELVLSLQSGTGGASLNRQKPGESIGQITDNYPHWFAPAYAEFAGREAEMVIDQHALLAVIAPRRLYLANGRRDVWSDPNGAFRAALGANTAWEVYGKDGMQASGLQDFRPEDDVSFLIRPGGHGVTRYDVEAIMSVLDAAGFRR